jgi:hypothetical protein
MSDFNQNAGPQFELTETGGWGQRLREWLSNNGSSVILPIVALAILASGIYLYATQKRQQTNILLEENPAVIETETPAETIAVDKDQEIVENLAVEPVIEPAVEAIEILPEKRENSDIIVVTAGQGEGVTHLARKALKAHLGESSNLTKEHKIYIEDYIKDKIGSKTLEVGEEIEISESLLNEAINSANKLTAEQLKVIEQFSKLVGEI